MPVSRAFAQLRTVHCCVAIIVAALADTPEPASRPSLLLGNTGYQIRMPLGEVVPSIEVTESLMGDITTRIFTVRNGRATWTANYTVLPKTAVVVRRRATLYRKASDALLRRVRGTLVGRRDLSVGGVSGVEVRYRIAARGEEPGLLGCARFALIDETLFVLDVVGGGRDTAGVKEFFGSFRGVEAGGGVEVEVEVDGRS